MDNLLRYRDDEAHDEPAVTLDSFLEGQTNAGAVRIEAGDDARALLPHLGQLGLHLLFFVPTQPNDLPEELQVRGRPRFYLGLVLEAAGEARYLYNPVLVH